MKYQKNTRRTALVYEKDLVSYWEKNKTFEKSVEQRPEKGAYVFYDGPPFITGVPHAGTLLSSIIKDAVPRYWTMKGKRVERRWGWDCHGLPAEVFTEKKLGIKNKQEVYDIGLETYINTCRANMVQTGSEWEDTIKRIGRWVDFKGAWQTMDKEYMESVWWAFKELYNKKKIYEGEKVLLYCVRDATPISKAEVAMDNSYQDVTDPSVFVKFKLVGTDTSVLAWTTTPWTLPANTAVAVNERENYSEVSVNGEKLILATALLDKVLTDEKHQPLEYVVNRTLKGSELVDKSYEPLFENRGENAHKIWHADYVTLDEGTGIVHLAPAYGEEDYALSKEKGFPFVSVIDDNGFYNEGEWKGQYIWDANKPIAKELHERGVVFKITYITHSYPHCHRCGTKLMYRAHPSWFMDIDGQRAEMLEKNQPINWFPEHIKNGRFAKTVESAPDWNLSRDRFWATAMPVWKGTDKDGKEVVKVVGSYKELHELSGQSLDDYHRPWVDDITFTIDDVEYKRIDKVFDSWFESGSMPFAQFHYPFENVEKFEQNFPGDFIAEYVGQVRAWFYYLHSVSVGLFGKNAFNNVVVTGTVAGNDGRKMSKSFGNYTDPNELMDLYSADAFRFTLLSSSVMNAEDYALQDRDVADTARKLGMIWNMYDFFTLYAEVDKWEWDGKLEDPSKDLSNILDQWIVSRVHQLSAEVDEHMQQNNLPRALAPVLAFVDDASNWYVRRSRSRFWKSEEGADKANAYKTLHYTLTRLSLVLAPFTPFLAEELYRNLTGGESVHLLDWPETGQVNEPVVAKMHLLRQVITSALAERALAGLKVRQPLQSITFKTAHPFDNDYLDILKDELNVKEVISGEETDSTVLPEFELDLELTPELKREGLMREVVRQVQNARKQAGLNVDDRIKLSLHSDDPELTQAITEYAKTITAETLAVSLTDTTDENKTTVTIEGAELQISLQKA
jgi:isoleucyl-tRNA synthetase